MTQVDIEDALSNVRHKYNRHLRETNDLQDHWLEDERPKEYRKRLQTHEAWKDIVDPVIVWLLELKEGQKTISERKLKNKKRSELRNVVESDEYPEADLPEPKTLIE